MDKLRKILKQVILLFLYTCISANPTSGEANYTVLSTITFKTNPPLTIEKNNFFSNQFNIVADQSSTSLLKSTTWRITENPSNQEFRDTNLVSLSFSDSFTDFEVSVSSISCVFPLVFGTRTNPTVSISGKVARMETLSSLSNFNSIFGESRRFDSITYNTKDFETRFGVINVFCPFYLQVRLYIHILFLRIKSNFRMKILADWVYRSRGPVKTRPTFQFLRMSPSLTKKTRMLEKHSTSSFLSGAFLPLRNR